MTNEEKIIRKLAKRVEADKRLLEGWAERLEYLRQALRKLQGRA